MRRAVGTAPGTRRVLIGARPKGWRRNARQIRLCQRALLGATSIAPRLVGVRTLVQANPIADTIFPAGMDQAWRDAAGMVAVPEPTTALLLGLGLIGLSMRRRRAI